MKLRSFVNNPIPIKRPKGVSNEQWTRALRLYKAAKNVGDKFPELTVAQAALETGWFKKESGKNNFFGQKATKSQPGSDVVTHEVFNGEKVKIIDRFRDYESVESSLEDRKKKWMSKYQDANTPSEAISKIWQLDESKNQGKGYATDPNYGGKIETILTMMGVENNKEKPSEKPEIKVNKFREELPIFAIDNTDVNSPKVPELATQPFNGAITEDQLREILQTEKSNTEQRFLEAFNSSNFNQEDQYLPQEPIEDLNYLYNYIKLDD